MEIFWFFLLSQIIGDGYFPIRTFLSILRRFSHPVKTPFLVGCILQFSLIRIYIFSYLFCNAEKSKDVGDHWNSLQYQRHGKEMEVIHFSFPCLNYFKIWSGWISSTHKREDQNCKRLPSHTVQEQACSRITWLVVCDQAKNGWIHRN